MLKPNPGHTEEADSEAKMGILKNMMLSQTPNSRWIKDKMEAYETAVLIPSERYQANNVRSIPDNIFSQAEAAIHKKKAEENYDLNFLKKRYKAVDESS